ncbi:MAG: 4-(cytidine 5'-diphospho)-2-C-methyl-D-erythritol kinase [Treponema sp.]|jgi:4-diphosphocytidyl-2-C-methyl-D-erythritol kinase|nr:4-(cytidine 5'-diphospho)-2-C-methyl-D-erythritol kinase [Treponema sp.]
MARVKVAAPSKINLHLSVGERRADGYHDLESIFQTLDFGDSLSFEVLEGKNRCDILTGTPFGAGFPLPPEENIVFQAVSVFRRRTGFDQGLRVFLEKRIPLGGGLGGGSSDAAAALAALDMLAGTCLSLAELRDMALLLGSDVPFFLADPPPGGSSSGESWVSWAGSGGAAWVSGRGDRILPLDSPPWPVLLVNPGFSSPTGEAFRRLDLWRYGEKGAGRGALSPAELREALSGDPAAWPYWNDFLPALDGGDGESSVYRRILSALRKGGADFAGLSGAGSTCFGVFKDQKGVERTAKLLSNEGFLIYVTFFLARSSFRVLKW